jgi:hypothetical protein
MQGLTIDEVDDSDLTSTDCSTIEDLDGADIGIQAVTVDEVDDCDLLSSSSNDCDTIAEDECASDWSSSSSSPSECGAVADHGGAAVGIAAWHPDACAGSQAVEAPDEQGQLAVCTEQVCAVLDKPQLKAALGAEANTAAHEAEEHSVGHEAKAHSAASGIEEHSSVREAVAQSALHEAEPAGPELRGKRRRRWQKCGSAMRRVCGVFCGFCSCFRPSLECN